MDIESFQRTVGKLWNAEPQVSDFPRDRRFNEIVQATHGMATENKLAILNHAVNFLGRDEVYLEIGTYVGTSVIGAALGHPDAKLIAIDNFSQFNGPEKECRSNLQRFASDYNIELRVQDAWEALSTIQQKIGVYFYDGGHTYPEQRRAFEAAEPHLADSALVFIDDVAHSPVRAANDSWCIGNSQYERIFRFESPHNGEPRWWNGLDVWAFRRQPRHTRNPQARHLVNRIVYGPLYENTITGSHRLVKKVRSARGTLARK